MTVIDDNRDNKDEIIVTAIDDVQDKLHRYRYGYSTDWSLSAYQENINTNNTGMVTPFVAGGDYDGDNAIIEYTGEKSLSLPNPMIMVVLAAPPVHEGIDQNIENSETSYGKETSLGSSATDEVSISTGITLSFEAGDPLGIISASASATLEREFTKTTTESSTVTTGVSYSCGYPDDSVIFQGTLYMCYKYTYLSHPDPALVGTAVTIDVPVKSNIYKWTVPFFNDTISGLSIGSETFSHTPGDVSSYPNVSKRDELIALYSHAYQTTLQTVGQGNRTNNVTLDLSEESLTGSSYSIGVRLEAGLSVAGVGFSSSIGYNTETTYEISVGTSTHYEGVVGDISASDYSANQYFFGLFIYDLVRDDKIGYQVVNYWIE
jgi:hypothetical protein